MKGMLDQQRQGDEGPSGNLTGIWRSRDRWRGLLAGLLQWKIDMLADHSIHLYAEHIAAAVENENRAMAGGKQKKTAAEVALPEAVEPSSDAESAVSH
jgi:hypothetical protein